MNSRDEKTEGWRVDHNSTFDGILSSGSCYSQEGLLKFLFEALSHQALDNDGHHSNGCTVNGCH